MTVLAEDDLQITLPKGVVGRKFDDETSHGLSHCMKAVDFIIELEDRIFFVEIKDPENPNAKPKDSDAFLKKFLSGAIDSDLKAKYRDSWLYEFAEGRAKKPIYYLVLIGARTLSDAELLARTDALKRQIPMTGPSGRPWKKPFVAGCAVMNLAAWNKTLAHMPASRVGP
jgi:hypothetical protein